MTDSPRYEAGLTRGYHHRSPSRRTNEIIQAALHRHFRGDFGKPLPPEKIASAIIKDGNQFEFLALLPRCRYMDEEKLAIARAIAGFR
jgi:hypothetical protein